MDRSVASIERGLEDAPAPDEIRVSRRRRRAMVTIVIGFTLLVMCGAFVGVIAWQSDRKLAPLRNAWRLHDAAAEVLTELLNAESSQWGYLIAADPGYLASYTLAMQKLPAAMARLQALAARVHDGSADAIRIATATDAKRLEMDQTIALQRNGEHEQALQIVGNGVGEATMDQIRVAVGDLETIADAGLRRTSAVFVELGTGSMLAVAGAALAVIALAALLIRDTIRHFRLLARRETSLRRLASGLARRVAWRTRSLAEMSRRFDTALRTSCVTVFTQDSNLVYTRINRAAFGLPQDAIIGHSDDDLLAGKWRGPIREIKSGVIRTGETARTEVSVQEGDVERWYSLTVEAQRGTDRAISGIVGGAVDITDRKEHEARIDLLMRELTHRSRNLLSVIQAIAWQSAASSVAIDDFLERFGARLQSLGDSQDLLVRDNWRGVSMRELVRLQLGPYADVMGSQIELDGGAVRVGPDAAQHIGMALHELATNAATYGALSSPVGKVRIHWGVATDGTGGRRCHLSWRESDGPKVDAPKRRGFGHVVIERTVVQALDGKVTLTFAPSGVCWELDFSGDYLASGRAGAPSGAA